MILKLFSGEILLKFRSKQKLNSKQFIDLNAKHKSIKHVEGRIRVNRGDPGFNDESLDTIPKACSRKEKVDVRLH